MQLYLIYILEENKTLRTERLTFVLEYNSRFSRLIFQYGADFENILDL